MMNKLTTVRTQARKLSIVNSTNPKCIMSDNLQPSQTPKQQDPKFGFNNYAEKLNGRAAMVGFLLLLVIEYFTGQGVLAWLGLR